MECRNDGTPTPNAEKTVEALRQQIEDHRRRQARRAGWVRRFVPTGLQAIDEALPHGGLPCGAITEILAASPGVGSMSLALRIAAGCIEVGSRAEHGEGRGIVYVDTTEDFYPPAVLAYGLPPDRFIVIRVRDRKDAFWAVDQSLRCPAVAAVVAPLDGFDQRASRRLQLAAESSGALGLLLRPAQEQAKSFAAVRMLVQGARNVGGARSVSPSRDREGAEACGFRPPLPYGRGSECGSESPWHIRSASLLPALATDCYPCWITLLTVREGTPTKPFLVDLHHETGALSVPALPVDRPAAKTG